MKLYYMPGACSFAPHMILHEAGFKHEVDKLDRNTRKTASGEDYNTINPKGYVPALRLDDWQILTEATVVLQYHTKQKPESGLAPRLGTMERYRQKKKKHNNNTKNHKTNRPKNKPNHAPTV